MKIYLASDHGGFELKKTISLYLKGKGYEVEDCGAFNIDPTDDYPDWISKAAEKISQDPKSFSIIFGKSGGGEAIVANKFKNVRAVIGFGRENVKLAREHNDANVLSLGGVFVNKTLARELVDIFLNTPFSGEERHSRRIDKISLIESK